LDEVMQEISSQRDVLANRILPIVEKLFRDNNLYQLKLDKQEMVEMLVNMFGQFTQEEMKAITEDALTRRIRKILTLEAVSGTLNDLTPEQIAIFDAAVEGR
jgi:dihydroxyacetone kinase